MSATMTQEEFENQVLLALGKEFKIKSKYIGKAYYVVVEDNFGINYSVKAGGLTNGYKPSFKSALSKVDYILKKSLHDASKYIYCITEETVLTDKIKIFCKEHGHVFEQQVLSHLNGTGCPKCGLYKISKQKLCDEKCFREKLKSKHGDKLKVKYFTNLSSPCIISCNKHGNFSILASYIINGQYCPKCSKESQKESFRNSPTGWNKTNWFKSSLKSKNFESFKVYIIKCYNDEEDFYKIGRTYTKIKNRFYGVRLPYDYKVIKIFESNDVNKVWDLENKLKQYFKSYKYIPKIKFSGMYECFSTDMKSDKFFDIINNIEESKYE